MKAYFNDIFITDNSNGIATKVFAAIPTLSSYTIQGSNNRPTLTFYKGLIPSTEEMNGFLSSSRSADGLLQFSDVPTPFSKSGKRVTFNYGATTFATILGTGTIGWFCTGTSFNEGVAPYNNIPMLFGTVGLTGSGADLELPKIDVNAGELWLCTDMGFDISNELVYS